MDTKFNIQNYEPSPRAEMLDLLRELSELQPWNYEELKASHPKIAERIRIVASLPQNTRKERRIWADSWKTIFRDMKALDHAKVASNSTRGAA